MNASRIFTVFFALCLIASTLSFSANAQAGVVSFKDDQLFLDGKAQPQLFGAELQYFRLRGGYERNQPRAKVIETWNRALDRMVEAKMNVISFYIPWDFHEYAEGKFDFTGTADEDGDGKPDYPSRDLMTFFKMIEEHGITRIMVRPGPYINAEWGFLGFGAVPKWFHEKFPNSHMKGPGGNQHKLYDYHNPELLRYSEIWMRELYARVLKDKIGAGKPIHFVQLDNETNFQWNSIFTQDYGQPAILRYREFLKAQYATIQDLNRAHGRNWTSFAQAEPSKRPGVNAAEDQDWYRFQDHSMHGFLGNVRKMWENLGLREPTVLFTLAESYNAAPNGILPHYRLRNDPGVTGMMTVNLYPKTYETSSNPLMNLPFKADHDVKAAESANDKYIGSKQEWVMAPELQGGWWKGIGISAESRRQTYLTTLGHGVKAFFVYYFTEGQNWQVEGSFPPQHRDLFFDAPLDGEANPRPNFYGIKEIGEKIIAPYGDYLGRAVEMTDPVCFLREDEQHAPSTSRTVDALAMNGEWAGALIGYLLQVGVNPRIVHWGINSESDLNGCQIVIRQDNGTRNPLRTAALKRVIDSGRTVVNLLDGTLAHEMGLSIPQANESAVGSAQVKFDQTIFYVRAVPLFSYDLTSSSAAASNCTSYLNRNGSGSKALGYSCAMGAGRLVQIGANFYDQFNSDSYADIGDVKTKRTIIEALLRDSKIVPRVRIKDGGDRTVAFGRTDGEKITITTKTGQKKPVSFFVQLTDVDSSKQYRVKDLFTGVQSTVEGSVLKAQGFAAALSANGSSLTLVEPAN